MSKLKNRVALISGAGRGIGRAIALRYAREGASVVVVDLDESAAQVVAEEIRSLDLAGDAFRVDVREPDQSAAMVSRVADRFGRLDIGCATPSVQMAQSCPARCAR